MKKYFLFLIFGFSFSIATLQAQSVYQFQYQQKINDVAVPTYALFFQYEDGSGFLRVRYKDPQFGEEMLLGYALDEENIVLKNGNTDTTQLYIKAINSEIFIGNVQATKATPVFLFSLNKNTGDLEPSGVVRIQADGEKVLDKEANFKSSFVQATDLNEELFLNYFQEGDEFLKNFFSSNTKDITPAEKTMTLHMLVVANTLEKKIGQSCAMDTAKIIQLFRRIALYIGCDIKVITIAGKNYSKKSLLDALAKLKPVPDRDMVVFYYSGHGYRKPEDDERFPYLDLRANDKQDYLKETMNMAKIDSIIKSKKARVNIVLSDCCNSYVGASNAIGIAPLKKKSNPLVLNMNNVRTLFLNGKVSILATAADRSQKATSNNQFGGFFTNFFKMALEQNCSQTQPALTWFKVLDEAKAKTSYQAQHTYCDTPKIVSNICNQSPSYRVVR